MKKNFFYFFLVLFFSNSVIFSQELSNKIFDFLSKNKFSPVTQSLVAASGENLFAYNVISKFSATDNNENKKNEKTVNLILIFNQEDFFETSYTNFGNSNSENKNEFENSLFTKNRNMIKNVMNEVKTKNYEFNIYFLFAYGEKQKPEKQGMIYGSQIFLESLNSNEDSTVIIFGLNEQKNQIITKSKGITSASYLIQNEFNILLNNNFKQTVPHFYLSQLFRLSVFEDRMLTPFFENEIPAVKIDFCTAQPNSNQINDIDYNSVQNVILQSIEKFSQTSQRIWEQHFFMFNFFGKYLNFSEKSTVKVIILIAFIWISFLTFFVFINNNKKKYDWQRLKKIWYVVPLTFLLILFSFWIGRLIFSTFSASFSDESKVFGLFCTQFLIAFSLNSVFYNILLYFNPYFEEYSIDFLITFCCFINQSLFILIDISLFPIFMFICLLSVFALTLKNNALHIGIFIVMAMTFLPYFRLLIKQADFLLLRQFCFSNNKVLFFFTLILYPIFIVYFRILTSFKRQIQKKSIHITVISVFFAVIVILILTSTFISIKSIKKQNIYKQSYYLKASEKNSVYISYKDKKVFDDTIRTLEIQFDEIPLQCNVSVQANKNTPILYSDNDFVRNSVNSVYFKIPNSPPKKLKFTYCSSKEPCTIIVTAIFESAQKNIFNLMTKSIKIDNGE